MNEPPHYSDNPNGHERAVLFALASSRLVTRFPEIILGYLLIDISLSFERSVGVMGLLLTSASSVTAIGAIFMGVVSLRVKHKSLLLLGLVFFSISAFGCTFAPNFMIMLLIYTISGVGLVMAAPMTYTLQEPSVNEESFFVQWKGFLRQTTKGKMKVSLSRSWMRFGGLVGSSVQ